MASKTIKFIHASDFQLGRPVCFFSDSADSQGTPLFIPSDLNPELPPAFYAHHLMAAYHAAERVFDAAIHHGVNFVLLTGDLFFEGEMDAPGVTFLQKQFQRLAGQGIWVYWVVGDDADSEENLAESPWWSCQPLPENVVFLGGKRVCKKQLHFFEDPNLPPGVGGLKVASSSGQSASSGWGHQVSLIYVPDMAGLPETHRHDLQADDASEIRIVVAKRLALRELLSQFYFSYGVAADIQTRFIDEIPAGKQNAISCVFHVPGAPQAFSPEVFTQQVESEQPMSGCSIIELDVRGEESPKIQFIATESISWRLQRLVFQGESVGTREIIEKISQKTPFLLQNIPQSAAGMLVFWVLHSEMLADQGICREIYLNNRIPIRDACSHSVRESFGRAAASAHAKTILAQLNADAPSSRPALWHAALLVDSGGLIPPNWAHRCSAVADLLFLADNCQKRAKANPPAEAHIEKESEKQNTPHPTAIHLDIMNLSDFLTPPQRAGLLQILAANPEAYVLENLLNDAKILGASMLDVYESAPAPLNCPPSTNEWEETATHDR